MFIAHAARIVRDLNLKCLSEGKGAPVTARFGADGITIVDLNRMSGGKVFPMNFAKAVLQFGRTRRRPWQVNNELRGTTPAASSRPPIRHRRKP